VVWGWIIDINRLAFVCPTTGDKVNFRLAYIGEGYKVQHAVQCDGIEAELWGNSFRCGFSMPGNPPGARMAALGLCGWLLADGRTVCMMTQVRDHIALIWQHQNVVFFQTLVLLCRSLWLFLSEGGRWSRKRQARGMEVFWERLEQHGDSDLFFFWQYWGLNLGPSR
jgi:hypothetical protein